MATRRRWLQFSLRGVLALLTVFAIGLAWTIERARQRGNAIHAIQKLGASVFYDDGLDDTIMSFRLEPEPSENHIWLDLTATPVDIHWVAPIDENAGSHLQYIYGVHEIQVWGKVTEADLHCLEFTGAETILIVDPEYITQAAEERLRRRLPDAAIRFLGRNFSLGHFDYQ